MTIRDWLTSATAKLKNAGIDSASLDAELILAFAGNYSREFLPIPAFDGGRWYLLVWYKIRSKELTEERESHAVGVGVLIVIAIFILVTLSDILKLL